MVNKADKNEARLRRHRRVRGKISGTAERPRLDVFRSAKHIYAQVIDDEQGVTLASASSMDKDFNAYGGNIEAAKKVGEAIAKKCLEKGITEVVYDRGGFVYQGLPAAHGLAHAVKLTAAQAFFFQVHHLELDAPLFEPALRLFGVKAFVGAKNLDVHAFSSRHQSACGTSWLDATMLLTHTPFLTRINPMMHLSRSTPFTNR